MQHPPVARGTIVVWSDLSCPWATLALHRLRTARTRLGFDSTLRLIHRAFPLELINARPTPKELLESEMAIIGAKDATLVMEGWSRAPYEWPGTVLVAMEAVQAAKAERVGGLRASEELDAALRYAFFAESRPIQLLTEVLDVARSCPAVDADALLDALTAGTGRRTVLEDWRRAGELEIPGSPTFVLPDGQLVHNPGTVVKWQGKPGAGFPQIVSDDPSVYEQIVRTAAA